MPRTSNPRRVRLLDPIEEARLQAEIAADPDAREATDEELAKMRPAQDVLPPGLFKALTKRGRPKAASKRVQLTLRVDPAVLAAYKAAGPGWQTRMNETLARGAAYARLTERTPLDEAGAPSGRGSIKDLA